MTEEKACHNLRERLSLEQIQTDIVKSPEKHLRKEDLSRFFIRPKMSYFCLKLLISHSDYTKNDAFRSLTNMLQDWNRKMKKKTDTPTQLTFMRCKFIFSNLLYSLTLDSTSRKQLVEHLAKWNHQQRLKNPDNSAFRKDRGEEQDWLVRETLRNNMAQQIDSYHRKVLGYSIEKERDIGLKEKSQQKGRQKSQQKEGQTERKQIPNKKEFMRYRDLKESLELQKRLKQHKQHKSHLSKQSLSSLTDSKEWISATITPNSPPSQSFQLAKQISYRLSRIHLTDQIKNSGFSIIDNKDKSHKKHQIFSKSEKDRGKYLNETKSKEDKIQRVRRMKK